MLVLTRKQGEVLQIGDHITVTIVDLRNGRVRIGIDAPPDVAIRRGELVALDSTAPTTPTLPTGKPHSSKGVASSATADRVAEIDRETLPLACVWPRPEMGNAESCFVTPW